MPRLARPVVAMVALALAATACHTATPEEQRASLCAQLVALHATIAFLRDPAPGARVGQVRGDLDKLDPTITQAHTSDVVDDAIGQQLFDAQKDYRSLLSGIGDDDRFSTVGAGGQGEDLWGAYAAVTEQLGCGESLVSAG